MESPAVFYPLNWLKSSCIDLQNTNTIGMMIQCYRDVNIPPPHTHTRLKNIFSPIQSPRLSNWRWRCESSKFGRSEESPFLMTTQAWTQLLLVSLEEKSVSAWVAGLLKHYYENQCPREVPWSDHWVSDNVNNGFGLCNPQTETEGNEYTLLLLLLLHSFLYRFFWR